MLGTTYCKSIEFEFVSVSSFHYLSYRNIGMVLKTSFVMADDYLDVMLLKRTRYQEVTPRAWATCLKIEPTWSGTSQQCDRQHMAVSYVAHFCILRESISPFAEDRGCPWTPC